MRTILPLSLLIAMAVCIAAAFAQIPPGGSKIVPATRIVPTEAPALPRDVTKLPEAAQPVFLCASRALEWLRLTNKPDGRFVYGFQPALRVQLDGDNFLSQAGATFALARAARYFHDSRGAARASQAVLSLDLETMADPADATVRYTAAPPGAVNRLSANGLLISAIHELESAQKYGDLLAKADQMCNYLRRQQRADGSLLVTVGERLIKSAEEADACHAGWALQGIIRSQAHRPADWKLDMLRKATAYYHPLWQKSKSLAIVCSHTPAYAEAYVQTGDASFAKTVFAMNDWLIEQQYGDGGLADKHWLGGFPRIPGGKRGAEAPDITSALAAESLADACRVARKAGDLPRLQRYERALLLNFQFLMSLQYTPKTTEHFAEFFRPSVRGAFHASHQDGNLKIDYTRPALCAMVQYLEKVVP